MVLSLLFACLSRHRKIVVECPLLALSGQTNHKPRLSAFGQQRAKVYFYP